MTRAAGEPRVGVVVLHWGDVSDTLACVASVARSTVRAEPLVVIDNGTGRLPAEEVRRLAPGAVVAIEPVNLGFAGGANSGIRRALADGADHVLLLNNDATLEPTAVAELLDAVRVHPRVGAVGAKVLSAADPGRLWMAWGRVTWGAALVERVGRGALDGSAFAETRDVEWVPGCALLLTGPALAAVGLLDERFFAYHEDVDWCVRARSLGYAIVFAPRARVLHRGEASQAGAGGEDLAAEPRPTPARYLSARNTVLFARKHATARQMAGLALRTTGSLVRMALRGARHPGRRAVLRLLVQGYLDGLRGAPLPARRLGLA